jgi:hypothetical protein
MPFNTFLVIFGDVLALYNSIFSVLFSDLSFDALASSLEVSFLISFSF